MRRNPAAPIRPSERGPPLEVCARPHPGRHTPARIRARAASPGSSATAGLFSWRTFFVCFPLNLGIPAVSLPDAWRPMTLARAAHP